MAVGISSSGSLYLGSRLVATSVTSAIVRDASGQNPVYLLYTTKDQFLHTRPVLELLRGDSCDVPETQSA